MLIQSCAQEEKVADHSGRGSVVNAKVGHFDPLWQVHECQGHFNRPKGLSPALD